MSGQSNHNVLPPSSEFGSKSSSKQINAALSGATKAFSKPIPGPKPGQATSSAQNGALLAANSSWASRSATKLPGTAERDETRKPELPRRAESPIVTPPKPKILASPQPRVQSMPPVLPERSTSVVNDLKTVNTTANKAPKPPPPRRSNPNANDQQSSMASSAAALASRSPPRNTLPPPNPTSPHRNSRYQDQSAQMLSPHVTGDNLADAIVGASLALSRNSSPFPTPIDTPWHRQQLKSPHRNVKSRGNSPRKQGGGLKETLRPQVSSSSSEEARGRPILAVRRHPHKHHEGDRKRWREVVTEDEFKRYAGLWASNRGLLFTDKEKVGTAEQLEDELHNFVVRELWQRSRLPNSILYEIWGLVDGRQLPRLTKSQFIVGMWLIDQRLKGRKLPVKVSQSVWESVERLQGVGVKIRLP
jgi:hypothetical protein